MGDRDSLGPAKQAQLSRRCDTIAAFIMASHAMANALWSCTDRYSPAVPGAGLTASLLYDVSDKFPAMPG